MYNIEPIEKILTLNLITFKVFNTSEVLDTHKSFGLLHTILKRFWLYQNKTIPKIPLIQDRVSKEVQGKILNASIFDDRNLQSKASKFCLPCQVYMKERKILERHRKGFDQETSEQITELTREKVSSHGWNMWEVSTNLQKIFVLVDLGEISDQAGKYFKVRFTVSE